jgi:hypothetical protein
MKRPHKNFVVEYKGSRRQPDKPKSIWGNLDLKSISRDVESEERRRAQQTSVNASLGANDKIEAADRKLTAADGQPTTALPVKKEHMEQDSEQSAKPNVQQAAIPSSASEVKKRRGPRAKKGTVNLSSIGVVAKPEAPAISDGAKALEGTRVKRAYSRTPKPAAEDDWAMLLQLEEENKNLRKLLAEKLRAENADLRRRLG